MFCLISLINYFLLIYQKIEYNFVSQLKIYLKKKENSPFLLTVLHHFYLVYFSKAYHEVSSTLVLPFYRLRIK